MPTRTRETVPTVASAITARYIAVSTEATRVNTTVFLMTTSMSYRRYFRIAMPTDAGIRARTTPRKASAGPPLPCSTGITRKTRKMLAARISHFTCCRSSPWLRRNRTISEAIEEATTTKNANASTTRAPRRRTGSAIGSCRGWAPIGSRRPCSRGSASANAIDHRTVTIADAHATGRHRGEGRRPSGKRRNVQVSRTPKMGTHDQLPSQTANVPPGAPGCVIVAQ